MFCPSFVLFREERKRRKKKEEVPCEEIFGLPLKYLFVSYEYFRFYIYKPIWPSVYHGKIFWFCIRKTLGESFYRPDKIFLTSLKQFRFLLRRFFHLLICFFSRKPFKKNFSFGLLLKSFWPITGRYFC